jgi:hypothetical protein
MGQREIILDSSTTAVSHPVQLESKQNLTVIKSLAEMEAEHLRAHSDENLTEIKPIDLHLDSDQNLTVIKSWGGKRLGAGRKPDPMSQRALCERFDISPYRLRQGHKVRVFDETFGTDFSEQIYAGTLKTFQALRKCQAIYLAWEIAGRPEGWAVPEKLA